MLSAYQALFSLYKESSLNKHKKLNKVLIWIEFSEDKELINKIIKKQVSFIECEVIADNWFSSYFTKNDNKKVFEESGYSFWELGCNKSVLIEGFILNNCLKNKKDAIGYMPNDLYILKSRKNKTLAMLRIANGSLIEVKGYNNQKINPKYKEVIKKYIVNNKVKLNLGYFSDLDLIIDRNGIHDICLVPKELNFKNNSLIEYCDFSKFPLEEIPKINLDKMYLLNNKLVKKILGLKANQIYFTKLNLDKLSLNCNNIDITQTKIKELCFESIPSKITLEDCLIEHISYNFSLIYKIINFKNKIKDLLNEQNFSY
jgi:hypothetical protein